MLHYLGVSTSGYYEWIKRNPSKSEERRLKIQQEIMEIYEDSHEIYGSPKITHVLNKRGTKVAQRTVTRYMHAMGIHAWYRRPYTITTISRDFSEKLKNILKRSFSPTRPDTVWCTDITYIHTKDGFLYLSCIMDLYSRKIVAWELAKTLETEHVINAIRKAMELTGKRPKIIHTDRGIQYTSDMYQQYTEGIEKSYSAKGNPWDNACIESFHALIKREWLWRFKISNYEQAYKLIFEYINAFYNTVRIHSHCEYSSPAEYEKQYYIKLKEMTKTVA